MFYELLNRHHLPALFAAIALRTELQHTILKGVEQLQGHAVPDTLFAEYDRFLEELVGHQIFGPTDHARNGSGNARVGRH